MQRRRATRAKPGRRTDDRPSRQARGRAGGSVVTRPVTASRWTDFEALFTSRGCPSYCWCVPYRFHDAHRMSRDQKRQAMRRRIRANVPVGMLAYADGEPVGWCSIAPRETYEKLDRSSTMPRVDDRPTWTVLCFFVKRSHRGQGVTRRLLRDAVAYARRRGARVVEGYPFDTAGLSSTHRGHSKVFRAVGFRPDEGRRWTIDA